MKRALGVGGFVTIAVVASSAVAHEGDTFRPYVGYARYYDSNLYRLAESEYALVPQRSDQYGVLSAGVNVDWRPGRQQVLARAGKSFVRFDRFSRLDYDGSDYSLKWNWNLGSRWKGQIGATRTLTQSSFSDLALQINNQITRTNRFASADWQFHPRWSVGLAGGTFTSENSTFPQTQVDYDESHVSATVGYATPKGSRLRGQLKRIEGEFPNRPATYLDRQYTQTELNVLGDWNVGGKLVTHGRIGYVRRANDTVSQRDFSGIAGRVSADYSLSGKTVLNLALFREIGNSDDLNASYQVTTGATLGAAWLLSDKVTLRASTAYDNRRFGGETGLVTPGLVQRDEDTASASLSLSYAPTRWATLDLGVQAGQRSSNVASNDYTFRGAYVSMRADF